MLKIILIFTLLSTSAFSKTKLEEIFTVKKPVIAALFLWLPEDLNDEEEIQNIVAWGRSQVRIMERQKVDAILWEYGHGGIQNPMVQNLELDLMARIINEVQAESKSLKLGVEILWHYPYKTLELAKKTNARFVRLDFFSDPMTASGEVVPLEPEKIVNFQKAIGAESVGLFTDIQVKYAKMIDPSTTMKESAQTAVSFGSDALIVSGQKSGHPPKLSKIANAKSSDHDIILGSGTNKDNVTKSLQYADAIIIGTAISEKTGGPLVESKVRDFMNVIFKFRSKLSEQEQKAEQ